eukprot:376804-Pelagomonas_calceolata.AAC.5
MQLKGVHLQLSSAHKQLQGNFAALQEERVSSSKALHLFKGSIDSVFNPARPDGMLLCICHGLLTCLFLMDDRRIVKQCLHRRCLSRSSTRTSVSLGAWSWQTSSGALRQLRRRSWVRGAQEACPCCKQVL